MDDRAAIGPFRTFAGKLSLQGSFTEPVFQGIVQYGLEV